MHSRDIKPATANKGASIKCFLWVSMEKNEQNIKNKMHENRHTSNYYKFYEFYGDF